MEQAPKRFRGYGLLLTLLINVLVGIVVIVLWLGGGFKAMANLLPAQFQSYNGGEYRITYPQGWGVKEDANAAIFRDPDRQAVFIVQVMSHVTTPAKELSPDTSSAPKIVDSSLQFYWKTATDPWQIVVPETITFAGTNWSQRAFYGNMDNQGLTQPTRMIFLANNQPTAERTLPTIAILYNAREDQFDWMNKRLFEPMLHSFHFQ